jgi:hypothetical protein
VLGSCLVGEAPIHSSLLGMELLNGGRSAAAALSKFGGYDTSLRWVSGDDDGGDAWQRVRLQAFVNSEGRIEL